MPRLTIALIELQSVAKGLHSAWSDHADVRTLKADDVLDELTRDPPDLIVVPDRLSKRSGFGLVNRMRHMEALDAAKVILVSTRGTQDALDHHQAGPTPADAYVLRPKTGGYTAFAGLVVAAAARLFPGQLTGPAADLEEIDPDDVEEVEPEPKTDELDDQLAEVIKRLGGYRVLRRLRDEDGGAVFACMDEQLDRPVAVKILPPAKSGADHEAMQRFLRERQVLAVVNSPYVLRVHGAGTHEGCPYLVRELVVGASLEGLLIEGPLEVDQALLWGREAALALKHAFDAGVVHRDVRPANIYIVDDHVKLARFGSGRVLNAREHEITMPDARMRNQAFCAPERVNGGGDDRSDIYSLGVTLHTVLAGRPPFSSARPIDVVTGKLKETPVALAEAREGIRKDIAEFVSRMMSADVSQRPQNWDEVIAALDQLRAPVSAGPPSPAPRATPEPSGIHGTLRRMSVIDLVQSLEMSRKTATITVSADAGEGTLVFNQGDLVYAAWQDEVGEDAFFALVGLTEGSFTVGFGDIPAEQNVDQPTMGLLLEAVRRRDEGAAGDEPPTMLPPATVTDSGWFKAAPKDAGPEDDDGLFAIDEQFKEDEKEDDEFVRSLSWKRRPIHSAVGYLAIAAIVGLGGWAGMQLPSLPAAPEPEDLSNYDKLIDSQRVKIHQLKAELHAARPALAAAAAQSQKAQEQQRVNAAVTKNLREVLAADVKDRRVRFRSAEQTGDLVIEIPSDIVFGGPAAVLTADGQALVSRVATAFKALGLPQVRIETHSDNRAPPPASGQANIWGLTGAQGQALLATFGKLGWTLSQVGYLAKADTEPLLSNGGPRGRARNRRVDLVITPPPSLLNNPLLAPPAADGPGSP